MSRERLGTARRGTFEATFTAASANEGFSFDVRAEGKWRRRGRRHQRPADAAASYVIDEVTRLAVACPILTPETLACRANAYLGRPVDLQDLGVQVRWASVHVHVSPEDRISVEAGLRLRARRRADLEDREERIRQTVVLRDLLREDPTLALAHLLLESPQTITDSAVSSITAIAEKVAAYAPGSAWVKTAQLLEKSFGELPADAKRFIIDRVCTALTEFGAEEAAHQILQHHHTKRSSS